MKHNYATVNKVSLHYICGGASQYVKIFQSSEAESKLSNNNYELLFSQTLKKITSSEMLTEEDKNAYIQS